MLTADALLEALERDLPVAYLEAIGHGFKLAQPPDRPSPFLLHVWLRGEAYVHPRPVLQSAWKPALWPL